MREKRKLAGIGPDAGGEKPEVYAVKSGPRGQDMSRREFLGSATVETAAVGLAASACTQRQTPMGPHASAPPAPGADGSVTHIPLSSADAGGFEWDRHRGFARKGDRAVGAVGAAVVAVAHERVSGFSLK